MAWNIRFRNWRLMLVLGAMVAALCVSVGGAGAAPRTPEVGRLTGQYRAAQQQAQAMTTRLTVAVQYAAKLDALIAKLKGKGQTTTALEQAAAAFRTGIEQARTKLQAASATLAAHTGFDDTGKVTNADQARATVQQAHDQMEQAHKTAVDTFKALHVAMMAYGKSHREAQEPTPPPAP
jgi:hypothetical protein